MHSDRFQLNSEDVYKWVKNAGIFLAPALLLFFIEIEKGSSFEQAVLTIKVWAISTIIDILRKFVSSN